MACMLISAGAESQLSIMEKAAAMGFDGIEFTDLQPPQGVSEAGYAQMLRAESDRLGLPIISYTVGAKCRARNGSRASDDEYGMYLTFHQINELLTAAREKCMMCDMTKETIARCTLRKTFDEIPTDAPASDGTDCPYYRII